MNIDNLNKLISFIEASKTFSMASYYHDEEDGEALCGTAGCIAGHASVLSDCTDLLDTWHLINLENFLSISFQEANDLAFPPHWILRTKEEALTTLRRLRDTGEVVWEDRES
jgi:hypothetical protein